MAKIKPFRVEIGHKVPKKAVGCVITDIYAKRDPMCPRSWVEFTPKPRARKASVGIEEMLSVCMAKVRGDPRAFIESLDAFFSDNGYLTKKQESALKKFYENAARSRK